MVFNSVRKIVSGKKARYEDSAHDFSLDLCRLTDRVILMGYPASGMEALYRNERSEVKRFLQMSFGDKYHIVNLCPRCENSYPASEFGGRVARFPFPDHLPPPLSLIPIFTDWATKWMSEDDSRQLVIHCKAGKGRSGTFAISYLLTLPELPSAPQLPDGSALDPRPASAEQLPLSMSEKIERVLDFHTSRRMAAGTHSRGVSISSQRRWIGYWGRILSNQDPRPKVSPREMEPRRVRIERVRLSGPGLKGVIAQVGGGKMAAQICRYKDGIATRLRDRELALEWQDEHEEGEEGKTEKPKKGWGEDQTYDDKEDMLVLAGLLSETSSSLAPDEGTEPAPDAPPADDATTITLIPSAVFLPPGTKTGVKPWDMDEGKRRVKEDGGIVVDGDREFMLKLLLGKTGSKHAKLHTMLALGIAWCIPSFESEVDKEGLCSWKIEGKDVDFLKSAAGVESVEVLWRWL